MSILEFRKLLCGMTLAFATVMMLPACSSTEEAPPPESSAEPPPEPTDTGDSGLPCDIDPGQPECLDQLK